MIYEFSKILHTEGLNAALIELNEYMQFDLYEELIWAEALSPDEQLVSFCELEAREADLFDLLYEGRTSVDIVTEYVTTAINLAALRKVMRRKTTGSK